MITKMKYISLSGHVKNMDYAIKNYLSRYSIQLEQDQSYSQLKPFTTLNPYSATLQKAELLAGITKPLPLLYLPLDNAQAVNLVEEAHQLFDNRSQNLRKLEENQNTIKAYIKQLSDFAAIDANLQAMENFAFTSASFGKLPIVSFLQYEKFLAGSEKIIFEVAKRSKAFIWGVYFTPRKQAEETATVFASLKFEPINITSVCLDESINGTPAELIKHWQNRLTAIKAEIEALTHSIFRGLPVSEVQLAIACHQVKMLYGNFDIKKYARLSPKGSIFTFFGWMPETEAKVLEAEIDTDQLTIFTYESEQPKPPTQLKNPPIIRQFEFFTKLYGLPTHGEMDPTPFLAIVYTLLFGLMFGDVGHGITLALLGLFVRHKWRTPLGGIMIAVGMSATVFGFLYGSVFGFEDIIHALWRRPAQDITATLLFATGLGVVIIVCSMLLNMYNTFRRGDIIAFLFGANGVAGLIFYASVVFIFTRVLFFGLPVTGFVVAIAIFPLLFVALKHPLQLYFEGKKGGNIIFSTIVELFETLLTYATNTISFVRVGAFAVSHAGLMHVVLQLSQGSAGSRNWLIIIAGNVLVLGIEGLLVGIQVLRLGFYEMFSRFYTGGGQYFTPQSKLQ